MPEDLLERIDINPQVMLGNPVIRGTRITVEVAPDLLLLRRTFLHRAILEQQHP
jgi:uncharacterized protein DUF433